jgi:hypothetical protein
VDSADFRLLLEGNCPGPVERGLAFGFRDLALLGIELERGGLAIPGFALEPGEAGDPFVRNRVGPSVGHRESVLMELGKARALLLRCAIGLGRPGALADASDLGGVEKRRRTEARKRGPRHRDG